ncbi:MAG: N-acetylgalactosamine-6-sulfatase [Pedosphaera sp. Tous-C6FEB]|nr:MAG: N-acetylgalactosamine-6-sulfatase [Pedosphaera sp. Tous-C6FEB]
MLLTRLFSVLLLATSCLCAAERKPNIIFILADDLGYGELGCYGQKLIATPQLDRMAAEGMRFTQFYAGSTVCAPSRSVLMTGLHTGHTRVRGNSGTANPLAQSLRPGEVTVARVLKTAGYATALIGKWGLGDEGEAAVGLPTRQGFDYFFGYANQHHAHNYYPDFLMRGEEQVKLRNKIAPGSADNPIARRFGVGYASEKVEYSHDLIAAEGLRWVEQQKDKPFFLYLALTTPHANNEANRDLKNGQEVPDFGIYADKDWSPQNKGQAAMIARMDRDIGRLFELLQRLKLDEHTLVFFSSDNGPHNEGGHTPELFQPAGPLRGMKRSLTDGGIRVPFLARWPGKIKPGVSAHVGWFADLLATACAVSGAPVPSPTDGVSLLPTLLGKPEAQAKHPHLYWEFHERGFNQAVLMDGRWKAIRLLRTDAPVAIYDLAADIGEARNLAAEQPELVARAKGLFTTSRTESPDWPIKEGVVGGPKGGKQK